MPQLDLHTYFTNFFWFIIIFFGLYILVLKSFLPLLLKNFIFRKYFLDLNSTNAYFNKNYLEYIVSRFQFLEAWSLSSLNFIVAGYLVYAYEYLSSDTYQYFVVGCLTNQVYFAYLNDVELSSDIELFYFEEN